ncbi:MAG TPA: maleylpyruvate isomerase family mycothiol-dependent enzyme [Jatrophihabitans sp.]|nr:maleylpyruvate isomerase family mycothiol-dependent enzyme [Jatrophihabitans sp.]
MHVGQLIDELEHQGQLLARAAARADSAAAVPSCPGWTVAAAVTHTARVHRRVTAILRGAAEPDAAVRDFRPEPTELEAIYRAGLAELVEVLRRAPDSLTVPTLWPAPSARHFWARRQAHETAIHRVDVELAAGYGVADFEPELAVDGLDELLLHMADRFSADGLDRSWTIVLTPLDANVSWTVRLGSSGAVTHRDPADRPDLSVFAPASDLYRWAWNRAGDSEVALRGELSLADLWHRNFTVRAGRL